MKEEADLCVWDLFADHARHKQKVVVMHPDGVATLICGDDSVGEGLVDVDVVIPRMISISLALWMIRNLIVEDRPENGFAEVRVVTIQVLVFHEHCRRVVVIVERILNIFLDRVRDAVSGKTNGADPGEVKLSRGARLTSGISETAVPLNCRLDSPSLVGKAPVAGTTSACLGA